MRASWHVIGIGEGLNIEKEGTINAFLVATADLDTGTQVHRVEPTPCMSMHSLVSCTITCHMYFQSLLYGLPNAPMINMQLMLETYISRNLRLTFLSMFFF